MGTPEIAEKTLKKLIDSKVYKPSLIITQEDKPIGRKQIVTSPPVKILAEKNNIEVLQPKTLKDAKCPAGADLISKIKNLNPDVIVVLAYGKIIPKDIIDIPKYGILNIHTSLLSKHRGASPIQYAILNGDKKTGITIMQIDEELDHGPIVAQKEIEISKDETSESLYEKLSKLGSELLIETLPLFFEGEITPKEQEHKEATFTKLLKREDGKIDPKNQTAEEIERTKRAFTPWPGIYLTLKNKNGDSFKLKILELSVISCDKNKKENIYITDDKKLILQTKKDCLFLKTVQPESKQKMSGYDFYLGYKDKILI